MVRDLTDPEMALCGKNKEAALEAKAKGNECFSKGDYSNALHFYSQVEKRPYIFLLNFTFNGKEGEAMPLYYVLGTVVLLDGTVYVECKFSPFIFQTGLATFRFKIFDKVYDY